MRATLHDELMREAGFETEYQEARARRRDARRERMRSTPVLVIRVLLLLAATVFLLDLLGFVDVVPTGWAAALVPAALTEVVLRLGRLLLRPLVRRLPLEWMSTAELDEPRRIPPSRHRGWSAP